MKVVCCVDNFSDDVSVNKIYDVIRVVKAHNNYYLINGDESFDRFYRQNLFITLEEFRDIEIDKILC